MRINRKLGSCYGRLFLVLFVVCMILSLGNGSVLAAQANESTGPSGYGWQQVYDVYDAASGSANRITGSADRQYYDYGYKKIQLYGRNEDYWSRDSGWWYITGTPTLNFRLYDGDGDEVLNNTEVATTKGVAVVNYTWGAGTGGNGKDGRGRWTATIDDGTLFTQFYLYVRGHMKVSPFISSSATVGDTVYLNASVRDESNTLIGANNVDNTGTSTPIQVNAIVTGGNEFFDLVMYDDGATGGDAVANDGVWSATFIPQSMGDHKILVKATDGHSYWVDGRGSEFISVSGSFPYGSLGLSLLKVRRGMIEDKFGPIFVVMFFFVIILSAAVIRGERHGW